MSFKLAISFVLGVFVFSASIQGVQPQQSDAAKHVHPTHGPHGGELLEIGKEEFHVEVMLDESKKQLVVYLLEKDAKSSIAIEATYLAVNLMLSGKPVQIKMKSMPQYIDPKGLSSCFGAVSPELIDALHNPKSDPKLAVRIHNKAYVTKIVHKHNHAGHDHAQQPQVLPTKKR